MTQEFSQTISTMVVTLALAFGTGLSIAGDISATPTSPRLQSLAAEIEKGNAHALETFWEQVKRDRALNAREP